MPFYTYILKALLLVTILLPAHLSAQCFDPDGDGYGTRDGRPCRARRTKTTIRDNELTVRNIRISQITNSQARITAIFSENASGTTQVATNPQFTGPSLTKTGFFRRRLFSQVLGNLEPNTTYFFRINAWAGKSKATSETRSFTTGTLNTTTSTTTSTLTTTTTTLPPTTTTTTSTTSSTTTSSTSTTSTITTTSTTFPENPGDFSGRIGTLSERVNTLLPFRTGFGRFTTGGADGELYVVNNTNSSGNGSLRDALRSTQPLWIVFHPSLDGSVIRIEDGQHLWMRGDKTIDGRGLDITIHSPRSGMFSREGNIIVAYINRTGHPDNKENAGFQFRGGRRYWIHHIDMTDIGDDGFGFDSGSNNDTPIDEITLSYVNIHNTTKAVLIGSNIHQSLMEDARVTIHNSILGAEQRNPFARRATVHMYNNVIDNWRWNGVDTAVYSKILVEHNIANPGSWSNLDNAYSTDFFSFDNVDGGYIWDTGTLFLGGSGQRGYGYNRSDIDPPIIPYDYTVTPASVGVMNQIRSRAGNIQ